MTKPDTPSEKPVQYGILPIEELIERGVLAAQANYNCSRKKAVRIVERAWKTHRKPTSD